MKKLALAIVGAAALALSGAAVAQTVPDEAFVAQLRAALNANPQLISDALNAAQAKQQAAQQAELNNRALTLRPQLIAQNTPGIVLGNPKGTKSLVEFLDYRCHYCQQMHAGVNDVIAQDKDLRVVIMMRPILGPDSEVLARFALAANLQGKFKAVHDALYTAQYKADDAGLAELAKATGVNLAKAKADMTGPVVSDRLAKNVAYAEQLQVMGTPYFVTASTVIPGATDKNNLLR
jgi:protein-disulfide isomerase